MNTATAIAIGSASIDPGAAPIRLKGAQNDYNAKGRGSTMARRVLRDGSWAWVSAPASRGRYLAGDRHDTQYGDVWVGEIVAEYTLGGRGTPAPEAFFLVTGGEKPLTRLQHQRRRDGQYALTLPEVDEPVLVADPAWR